MRVTAPTVTGGLHNMAKTALNTLRTIVKSPQSFISMHVTCTACEYER